MNTLTYPEFLARLGIAPVLTNNRIAGTYLPREGTIPSYVRGIQAPTFPFVWNVPRPIPPKPQPFLHGLKQPGNYGVQLQNGVASIINGRQTQSLSSPSGQLGITSLLLSGL